jgi:hypothetical protein
VTPEVQRLAVKVRWLAKKYPEAAARLHKLLDPRCNDTSLGSPARREAAAINRLCEDYQNQLEIVRQSAVQLLPEAMKQMPCLMASGLDARFHSDPQFDWKPLIDELNQLAVKAERPSAIAAGLTVAIVAEQLGVDRGTVYRHLNNGTLRRLDNRMIDAASVPVCKLTLKPKNRRDQKSPKVKARKNNASFLRELNGGGLRHKRATSRNARS